MAKYRIEVWKGIPGDSHRELISEIEDLSDSQATSIKRVLSMYGLTHDTFLVKSNQEHFKIGKDESEPK